jgi:hypothetical protein
MLARIARQLSGVRRDMAVSTSSRSFTVLDVLSSTRVGAELCAPLSHGLLVPLGTKGGKKCG